MNRYYKFLILFGVLLLSNVSNCQEVETSYGRLKVEFFLTFPSREADRNKVGASEESIDSIAPVRNEQMRQELKSYLMAVPKYERINAQAENENRVLYLYQTENFYYACWGYRPDDGYIRTSERKRVLVVIKKDLSNRWDFAG